MHFCANNKNAKQIERHITKNITRNQFLTLNLNVCVLRKGGSIVINQSKFTGTKIVLKT